MAGDVRGEADGSRRPVFKGEILLCEDNSINQHVINGHLTKAGFEVTIANDGKEGVNIVAARTGSGKRPFDLIFMDVYMPVMDGLKAADIISGLCGGTPIVAMSANASDEDRENYAAHNMKDALCKPFSAEELWTCLYKYLEPVSYEEIGKQEAMDEEQKRRDKLFTNFVKKNQDTFDNIKTAISEGDIKLAHRTAHTLRGLAGLMGKNALRDAARTVELSLAGGSAESLTPQELDMLGEELRAVLDELSPYLMERKQEAPKTMDKDKAKALFEKLEPLLADDSASCLELTGELRTLPGTDTLISQMEEYEFEEALETLAALRKNLEVQE